MTSLGVQIHPTAIVGPNVELGAGSVVGEYVILGRTPRGKQDGRLTGTATIAGGSVFAATNYHYDEMGRPDSSTARARWNTSAYTRLVSAAV